MSEEDSKTASSSESSYDETQSEKEEAKTGAKKPSEKEKKKKLIKKFADMKLPPLKKLQYIALENNISITNAKGDDLNQKQLYDKLKFRYPDLLKPKERQKLKTEYVKRYSIVQKQKDDFEKLKAKKNTKGKLTAKEEDRLGFLLGVIEKMDKKQDMEDKMELREAFLKKEKTHYDEMFSLSLLDNDEIFEYKDTVPMIGVLVKKVKKQYLQKALKKYVYSQNSDRYYSMLILYRVIRSMKPEELNSLVTDKEIQDQIDHLNKIEESFMTDADLEKIRGIVDSVVPKEDTVKKIQLFQELKSVKIQLKRWAERLKNADDEDDDDDDGDQKHEEDTSTKQGIKKIISKLKGKEEELIGKIKKIKNLEKDFYSNLEKSIQRLEEKLKAMNLMPLSKQDELRQKRLENHEKSLFNPNPFTFTHLSSVDEIEGQYMVSNPFDKDQKFVMATADDILKKPSMTADDIKNIMGYLQHELKFAQSVYDLLTEIDTRMDSMPEAELFKMLDHLYQQKIKYYETHPGIQRETVKYMAYRLLSKDTECKGLVSSLIEKQKEIHALSVKVSNTLRDKMLIIQAEPATNKEQIRIRHALDLLKKKMAFKDAKKQAPKMTPKMLPKTLPKTFPKMLPETFQDMLTRKALGSYETQQEMDEIDRLIHTYKFVDIGAFKMYKKALKAEMDQFNSSISKQFDELKNEDNEKKRQELAEKHRSFIKQHYKKIKAIKEDIKRQFEFTYANEQLKVAERTTSFHLPQHSCPPDFFKKPWIKGYTGIFYVNFVDLDNHVPDELIDGKDVFKDEETGELFYRGTRYLDILLCNRGRDEPDKKISTVKVHKDEDEYRIRIKYKVHKGRAHVFIDDNEAVYQLEQRWLKEHTEDFREQIVLFGKKIVKDVEKILSHFLGIHLSSYFEKRNADFLARVLINEYTDRKVEELFDRMGRLVVFLEEKYMKNEARVFNERLKGGYVRDVDVLRFSVTDILQDVYETISIQKDKCAEKIIDDFRKGKTVNVEQEVKDMAWEIPSDADLFTDKYTYSARQIIERFPLLCKDKHKHDIEKLNEKIEKSVGHYVKKTLFDLLTLTKLIKSGSIEPFRYTKTYKSLEKLDCYARGNMEVGIGTVFYTENGVVYCFSLSKLISQKITVNEYTGRPFSPEFMAFLGNLSIPVKTEAEMDIERDDTISELLQCFYDNVKELDTQASELDSTFKDVFQVDTDPIFASDKLKK